jgi:hypothetical protein
MVTSVQQRHERRRSSLRDGRREHTLVYLVICDDIRDGTAAALDDHRVPRPGDFYRGIPFAGKDAEPVPNSGLHFEVTVTFNGKDIAEGDVHPLSRPPEISWGASEATAPYFLDRSDPPKPTVNSAGDPFDQYLERDDGEMVITITINEATHDAAVADTFSRTVNIDPIVIDGTTYAPGTLKLSPITATKVTERFETATSPPETIKYYRRTYTLKARHEGWRDRVTDIGTNELVPGVLVTEAKKLKPIVSAVGTPVSKPWPLDGAGRKRKNPDEAPAELEFIPYVEKSWTALKFTEAAIWA